MRKRIVGVDSLRFLAMVMVVIYHCFPSIFPGGFIAVEMFFVISGYFICNKLVHASIEEKKFGSWKSFWAFVWDRIKRFAPVLLFGIVLTLTFAFFANRDLLTGARENTLYAATFSTNIAAIVRNLSYEKAIIPNLFNHTWFLALELQICIIFHLLLAVVFKIFIEKKEFKTYKRFYIGFGLLLFVLSIVSYLLMYVYGGWFSLYDRAYFGPDSHAGAFLLGAAMACFMMVCKLKPLKKWGAIILTIIAALLFGGMVYYGLTLNYASGETFTYALALTAVASAVILWIILRIRLYTKPKLLVLPEYIGKISFAVYLLHYPFNILLPSIFSGVPLDYVPFIAIGMSFLFAILLDKLIIPFSAKHKIIFWILLACSLIVPIVSLVQAPEKSSIEEQLEQEKATMNEQGPEVDIAALDYSGGIAFAQTVEKTMDYFEASTKFAKARPVASNTPTYTRQGSYNKSGRAPWNTPNLSNLSALSKAKVLVLGDSVVLGAQSTIKSTISGAYVDAMGSRNMADSLNLLATYRSANGGKLPRIIVIGLVTNYYAFTAGTLQNIINTAGPDHEFIFMTGYCGKYSRTTQNNTLRSFAQSHANVHIADWEKMIKNNPGLYTGSDHIHLNARGRTEYANLIKRTMNGL